MSDMQQRGLEGGDFYPGTEYPLRDRHMDRATEDMGHELNHDQGLDRPADWGMMLGGGAPFGMGMLGSWQPRCTARDVDEGMLIEASLPGVKPDDIELRIVDGDLVLSGQRREEKSHEGEGYWSQERSFGKFRRRMWLPRGVKQDQLKASFHNGILQVLVPMPNRGIARGDRGQIGSGPTEQGWTDAVLSPAVPAREEGGPIHEAGTKEETKPLLAKEKEKEIGHMQPESGGTFTSSTASTTMPANV